MPHPKKLIEVSLPLAAINEQAAREKSIRHGHPSTLHLWWARRPLAAARAVLWASLVDDPSAHPELFPTEEDQARERARMHKLLAELAVWENSNNERVLNAARAEIRKYMGDGPLNFLDPFAGGGAIPLEAQRLGLVANASDINPVAVLINKAMIEIPPRFAGKPPVNPEARARLARDWPRATGLAEDVRYYGARLREDAFKKVGHLYPKAKLPEGGEAPVIAWLWARTIKCPNPACGRSMPLASSFVLSKKKGREAWIEPIVGDDGIEYQVRSGPCPAGRETNKLGKGGVFQCPACGAATEKKYVYEEFRNGRTGARLMAIVGEGNCGRVYLSPDALHENAADIPAPANAPEGEMPKNPRWFSPPMYGLNAYADLFAPRQLTTLTTFSDLIPEIQKEAEADALAAGFPDDGIGLADGGQGARAYGEAVGVYLALVLDKLIDYNSAVCSWHSSGEKIRNTFGRQAIPMVWDYAESNPFCNSSGSYANMLDWVFKVLRELPASSPGSVRRGEAQNPMGVDNLIISCDPPYYDNIGYAVLSDYFYIWMRRSLKNLFPRLFATIMTPKAQELVATPYRFDGDKGAARDFFEQGMKEVFANLRASARDDVPVTIYYAYRQSDTVGDETASTGWETMLAALINAGFIITGAWPMRTELVNRQIASGTNALASSIVLVCRKRPEDAPTAARRQFLSALKRELPRALKDLQSGEIAPVDLAQAAIGPGMAVFSRFARVLDADGSAMDVRRALRAINAELDAALAERDSSLDDASRFCLDFYSQYGFGEIKFGDADVLARARNVSPARLADLGVLDARKGAVKLIEPTALDPGKVGDDCAWQLTVALAGALSRGGNRACAILLNRAPNQADQARDLAWRLYGLAERRGRAQDAWLWNSLVASWAEIQKEAANRPAEQAAFND